MASTFDWAGLGGVWSKAFNEYIGQSSVWTFIKKRWVGSGGLWHLSYDTTPGPLATIVVSPSFASIPTGGSQSFVADGFDADGRGVAISPTWMVSTITDSIDSLGNLTAGGTPGSGNTVTATVGSISGTASYDVV